MSAIAWLKTRPAALAAGFDIGDALNADGTDKPARMVSFSSDTSSTPKDLPASINFMRGMSCPAGPYERATLPLKAPSKLHEIRSKHAKIIDLLRQVSDGQTEGPAGPGSELALRPCILGKGRFRSMNEEPSLLGLVRDVKEKQAQLKQHAEELRSDIALARGSCKVCGHQSGQLPAEMIARHEKTMEALDVMTKSLEGKAPLDELHDRLQKCWEHEKAFQGAANAWAEERGRLHGEIAGLRGLLKQHNITVLELNNADAATGKVYFSKPAKGDQFRGGLQAGMAKRIAKLAALLGGLFVAVEGVAISGARHQPLGQGLWTTGSSVHPQAVRLPASLPRKDRR